MATKLMEVFVDVEAVLQMASASHWKPVVNNSIIRSFLGDTTVSAYGLYSAFRPNFDNITLLYVVDGLTVPAEMKDRIVKTILAELAKQLQVELIPFYGARPVMMDMLEKMVIPLAKKVFNVKKPNKGHVGTVLDTREQVVVRAIDSCLVKLGITV